MTTLIAPPLRGAAPPADRRPVRRVRPEVVLIVVVMWVYAAICVLPLITMMLNSFRTHLDIATVPWPWPVEPTLENYVNAWNQASFSTYTVNSVIVTVSSVVISTTVSLMAAYALTRWPFRGRSLVEGLFVSGLMIPFMLAILPIFYLMDWLRLIDSPLALILVYSAGGIPFSIFVFTAFFRNTPRELEEAAYMDGASHFGVFFRVVLPLVRPVIATVAVFRFVPIWNDFLMPLVLLRSRDNYTLGVGLSTFFGEYQTDWASLFAGLVIATLPLVVLFVVATRQIIDGLTAGIGK